MLSEADKLFNRYEITKRIGRGRFATVWQAFDPDLDDTVAIKEITIDSGKEDDAKNAIREGRILRALNSTHILGLWDIGIKNDCVYLIMVYADGGTVRKILEQRGPLPEAQVRQLMAQLCEGLAVAHDKGAVHRDLKPANLFICDGIPKIGDFGLSTRQVWWDRHGRIHRPRTVPQRLRQARRYLGDGDDNARTANRRTPLR